MHSEFNAPVALMVPYELEVRCSRKYLYLLAPIVRALKADGKSIYYEGITETQILETEL